MWFWIGWAMMGDREGLRRDWRELLRSLHLTVAQQKDVINTCVMFKRFYDPSQFH